jgi:sulfofructose kinase
MAPQNQPDKVIGVGFACVDQLIRWRSVGRPVDDNEVLDYDLQGGGMTATAMVAVTRLGGRAEFWGAVGDGPMAEILLDQLRCESVDVRQSVKVAGSDGPVYLVCVDSTTGERLFYCGQAVPDPPEPIGDLERLAEANCLLIDGSRSDSAIRAAREARRLGIPVVGDVGGISATMETLLPLMDYAIASEQCARGLGAGEDHQAACRMIKERGPEVAVVTLGRKGLAALDTDRFITMPAFDVDVVDTTGAGDVFHGAFCLGLCRGLQLESNLSFASSVAAISCTKLGGRSGIPNMSRAIDFLQTNDPAFDREQLNMLQAGEDLKET